MRPRFTASKANSRETGMQEIRMDGTHVERQLGLTFGLDIADSFTQFCSVDAQGKVVETGRVRTTTPALQRHFSSVDRARVVLEAGTHSHGSAVCSLRSVTKSSWPIHGRCG